MNINKYKAIDLLLLLIVGVATELLGCWLLNIFLPLIVPIFVSSMVVIIAAMVRWGPIGISLAPILALASYLADVYLLQNTGYSQQMPANYFVNLAFLLSTAVLIPFFVKKKDRMVSTLGKRILLSIVVYIIGCIFSGLVFGFLNYNIFISMLIVSFQQLMSLIITIIFIDLLYRQETLVNVKDRLIREKQEIEKEKEFYNSRKE